MLLWFLWMEVFLHFAQWLHMSLPTFHDSDRVLHLGSKDIWSKHSGEVLDTHLVLIAVRLDLIKESTEIYQS